MRINIERIIPQIDTHTLFLVFKKKKKKKRTAKGKLRRPLQPLKPRVSQSIFFLSPCNNGENNRERRSSKYVNA